MSFSPTFEAACRSSASSVRRSLVPVDSALAPLDGAGWFRCRDLGAELLSLTAALDSSWERITQVTAHPIHWSVVQRKVPVAGHVVMVGWFLPEQALHELLPLSRHMGRWGLLVVLRQTPPVSAAWLMAAASDPPGTSTASRLMEEARPRTVSETDRAVGAVWDTCPRAVGRPGVRSVEVVPGGHLVSRMRYDSPLVWRPGTWGDAGISYREGVYP
nr:DUF5994 family protein [Streptomyces cyaneochromogenes]